MSELAVLDNLSDAARYSFAAVCALALNHLFNNDWDQPFNEKCLKKLLDFLKLPQQTCGTMIEIMNTDTGMKIEPYVSLLKEEPLIRNNLAVLIHTLIELAVADGVYDARWRVLVKYVSENFDLDDDYVDSVECTIVYYLKQDHVRSKEEIQGAKSRERMTKVKRYAMIGLAGIGGGALIGVTGGLAAPFIGAGLGTVIGTSAALTALGSAAGAAVVGSLFGVAGAGLTSFKMHKRVGDIEEFEFKYLTNNQQLRSLQNVPSGSKESILSTDMESQLHITIAITGWLKDEAEDNFSRPWAHLLNSREQYYLKYESSYLLELGKAMEYFLTMAITAATQEALKYTILSGIMSAIAWPAGLIGLSSIIDNPWGVCCRRSAQVGKQLAEILLSRTHGFRPITLVGYSLGARVIYYCLREMSERGNCEGIVQDAYLIGAPCTANSTDWAKLRRVVAGKLVNGYSRSDWLLRFLYRTLSLSRRGVAGLQPIKLEDRRMHNVDLTKIVGGHFEYPDKIVEILMEVGVKTSSNLKTIKKSVSAPASPGRPLMSSLSQSQSDSILALQSKVSISDSETNVNCNISRDDSTNSTSSCYEATEVSK
nr:PREDICTED: transmembrane and coiled-coil domain-containing protein 4-like isoform X2 [Bemisia tabaci]